MLQSDHNNFAHYGRRSNIVFSGIPEDVSIDDLKSSVISVFSDIGVVVESKDIEASHRIGMAKSNKRRQLLDLSTEKLRKYFR